MYYLCVEVYVELVLFNNVAIDFALIVIVETIRRRKMSIFRALLASLIGGIIAFYYAVAPNILQILIKIFLSPLMCLIFDKRCGDCFRAKVVDFLSTLAIFVIATYFTGGVVFGLSLALNIDINAYAIEGIIALSIAICLLCARLIVRRRQSLSTKKVDATIRVGKTCVKTTGLCDSGNTLVDNVTGLPVVIFSDNMEKRFDKLTIDGFVNVQTVGGQCDMPIVNIDEICVGGKRCKAMGALSRKNFGDYDVILQNSIF